MKRYVLLFGLFFLIMVLCTINHFAAGMADFDFGYFPIVRFSFETDFALSVPDISLYENDLKISPDYIENIVIGEEKNNLLDLLIILDRSLVMKKSAEVVSTVIEKFFSEIGNLEGIRYYVCSVGKSGLLMGDFNGEIFTDEIKMAKEKVLIFNNDYEGNQEDPVYVLNQISTIPFRNTSTKIIIYLQNEMSMEYKHDTKALELLEKNISLNKLKIYFIYDKINVSFYNYLYEQISKTAYGKIVDINSNELSSVIYENISFIPKKVWVWYKSELKVFENKKNYVTVKDNKSGFKYTFPFTLPEDWTFLRVNSAIAIPINSKKEIYEIRLNIYPETDCLIKWPGSEEWAKKVTYDTTSCLINANNFIEKEPLLIGLRYFTTFFYTEISLEK